MVSGLTGTHREHVPPFRFFAQLAQAATKTLPEDLTPAENLTLTETTSDEPSDTTNTGQLSEGAKEMVSALSERNRDVQTHEAAHMAAGGSAIRGGATYTYQTGPDGQRYAIGGEVSVDMTPVQGNPRATIQKMMAIRAAAMSPADPSAQDMRVAAAAGQIEAQAQAQLDQQAIESPATPTRQTDRYAQKSSEVGTLINAVA
jgi:hypothetical protein